MLTAEVGDARSMSETRTTGAETARDERFERDGSGGRPPESKTPDDPGDLGKSGWLGVLKRTGKEFSADKLTHWAAALTYYGILSVFPALLALVSILGLIGPSATQPLIDNLSGMAPGAANDVVTNAL